MAKYGAIQSTETPEQAAEQLLHESKELHAANYILREALALWRVGNRCAYAGAVCMD